MNKEEETEEHESEWLMEEIQPGAPRPGKDNHENGHVTTKPVQAEALTVLRGDDQDSEDEVLTIPDVKVQPVRGPGPDGAAQPGRHPQCRAPRGRVDDRLGLVHGDRARRGRPRPGPPHSAAFHDDSDEDLLRI